jgi:hypothetical protein
MSQVVQTNGSTPEMAATITIERIQKVMIEVPIVGVTPLIPHRWSAKARNMMLAKQQGKLTKAKAPKDPSLEASEATYWMPDGGVGMPSLAFKSAIADAARYFDKSVTIESLKRAIYVDGIVGEDGMPLVAITGDPEMFEAMPRNATGVADLRYRNRVWPWSATLRVTYIESMMTAESVVNLVDASGIGGVGDWRPSSPKSKSGTYGTYRVDA